MQSSSSASTFRQQFIPLLPDSYHRTRQHSAPSATSNASIWAPQPQSLGGIWPGNSLGHPEHSGQPVRGSGMTPLGFPLSISDNPLTKEEVSGLPPSVLLSNQKLDATTDGGQRVSPFHEVEHVEQLLRSLNLNSPVPEGLPSAFDYNVSPSTSSSFPTTPVESSPTTPSSSDTFFNLTCDLGPSVNMRASSLTPSSVHPMSLKATQEAIWNEANLNTQRLCQRGNQNLARLMYQTSATFDSPIDNRTTGVFGSTNLNQRRNDWQQQSLPDIADWNQLSPTLDGTFFGAVGSELDTDGHSFHERTRLDGILPMTGGSHGRQQPQSSNEPINFLSLLHPSSAPPYALFVSRIVKSSDQQASIFLQQKLKVADEKERQKIVDAICTRGTEMMSHRFGNWAVQRCLEAASSAEERRKIASCMRGHVVELATNCYGCHVLQKALDCEEDIRLLIVSELLLGDPAKTLINKHASHVWSKIMEISWTPPAPPIFTYVNKALQGKWASLACHETGSLVVQHAFENLEDSAKDGIVDELLNRGQNVFADVAKNQWGSYCIQHILEHGCSKHKDLALSHILSSLLEFSTNEQGFKSVTKALKEGGKDVLDKFVQRMREAPTGGRRAIIVDLALSTTGSQLIASVLPNVDREQRTTLYDAIRGHIVTLRGCKTGSKVIWLFDRMVTAEHQRRVVFSDATFRSAHTMARDLSHYT